MDTIEQGFKDTLTIYLAMCGTERLLTILLDWLKQERPDFDVEEFILDRSLSDE